MNVLSNLLGRAIGPSHAASVEYRLAQANEIHSGLAMILGATGAGGEKQVDDFLQFCQGRGVNVSGMWTAWSNKRLVWALLPMISPGRTALLFTPLSRPHGIPIDKVIDLACDALAHQQIHLTQVLLEPADTVTHTIYAAQGFSRMAELHYLAISIERGFASPELPPGFTWENYSAQMHDIFAQTVLNSYRQSLDCPSLNGLRNIEDILAGHKAAGDFDPRYWFVLRSADGPIGVLLMCRVPRSDTAELVYLGLVPEARHTGLGSVLMQQALWAAGQMKLTRLTLAVDAQNIPALDLYYRHGMQRFSTKLAMMCDLRKRTAQP